MAEDSNSRSPRSKERSSSIKEFEFEIHGAGRDRKSLSGMSEKVKATLAPLLGGKKQHTEVEVVDSGRESGYSGGTAYEMVSMGSTLLRRYSTVEAPGTQSFGAVGASGGGGIVHRDTGSRTETTADGTKHHSRTSDVVDPENRGTGPQEIKGKFEAKTDDVSWIGSPIDPTYAKVDNFLPATMPKNKEYETYVKETGPQLRARIESILGDRSYEVGFERRLPRGEELPKLEDIRPIYNEALEMPQPTGDSSLLDKVKDTVTGQLPGHGIYSRKATSDTKIDNPVSERLSSLLQDRLPIQDVGIVSNVYSGTSGGRFDKDPKIKHGKVGSSGVGYNSNEDRTVLDGNVDLVD